MSLHLLSIELHAFKVEFILDSRTKS